MGHYIRNLLIFSVLFMLFAFLQTIPSITAQHSICDVGTPEPLGCVYTGNVEGYLEINTVIFFRNRAIPTTEKGYTDIGVITGYWWDINENRYGYRVLIQPRDVLIETPFEIQLVVFPEQVLQVFGHDNNS